MDIDKLREAGYSCNDCFYSMQNCNDKSICCEDETDLCDNYEPAITKGCPEYYDPAAWE